MNDDRQDIVDDSPMAYKDSAERAHTPELAKKAQERGAEMAAKGMESAAGRLREAGTQRDGMWAQVAPRVADGMDRTAGYLRDHERDDIIEQMQEHPFRAFVMGLVLGYLLAKIVR